MYQARIKELAPTYDPRHIEAFMRSERGTLDDLSPSRFRHEVKMAAACVQEGGAELAERIAKSYGLSRFRHEVKMAAACVQEGGAELAERIAKSYGL